MDLMEFLPGFYAASPEVSNIQQAFGGPVEELWQAYDTFMAQLDVSTSTWGLRFWEEQYGLTTDVTKPLEERRARVLSKMRGQGTTTVEMVQNVAESFVHCLVEVAELPQECRFDIRFVGIIGRPPNMEDLTAAIDEIKPAHLAYTFVVFYRTYAQLSAMTYAEMARHTYGQLREEDRLD